MLGGKCAACGEADPEVLEVDHIHPAAETGLPRGCHNILAALRKGRMTPRDVQLLCANCHRRKTRRQRVEPQVIHAGGKYDFTLDPAPVFVKP